MSKMRKGYDPNKVKRRKRKPIVYIICEGKETETLYFKHFRSRNCLVDIIPIPSKHKAAEHLVKHAKSLISQADYYPKDRDQLFLTVCIAIFQAGRFRSSVRNILPTTTALSRITWQSLSENCGKNSMERRIFMPYIPPEVVAKAKEMDLLTYLKNYEPGELVHFGGSTYCTRTHDSLKISNGKYY